MSVTTKPILVFMALLVFLLFFFLWIYFSWFIYLYGLKFCFLLNEKETQKTDAQAEENTESKPNS